MVKWIIKGYIMKLAFLVCKKHIAVDSIITETNLTLSEFCIQYAQTQGYASCTIIWQDDIQLRALLQTDSNEPNEDNTLGVIAFLSN